MTIKTAILLLSIGYTAVAIAAPDEAAQSTVYKDASLPELVNEMLRFQEEKKQLGEALCSKIVDVLPKGAQSYGEFDWQAVFAVDFIAANAIDSDKKQHAAVQLLVHPTNDEIRLKTFSKDCHGYPAKRFKDKWVWVLVGRTEIRLSVMNKEMQSDATLDAIIESFDLEKIEKL